MDKKISRKTILHEVTDYLLIVLGLMLYAAGWTVFILPYGITLGGVTGIAALVDLGTQGRIPLEYTYFLLNALLIIVALKQLGWKFCIKTIYAVFMLTVLLKLGRGIMADLGNPFVMGDGEKAMSCIIGACMGGIGVGMCFAHNGSTGGMDIVVAIINKHRDISFGSLMMIIDIIIIGCNYLVFHDITRVLFGYVALFFMSVSVDYYINSNRQSIQLFIFSHKHEEIADFINQHVHRGVTVLEGMGWYSKNERKVLFVLAKKRDTITLMRGVKQIDPQAFISKSNVEGVYGQGFDKIKSK